jgi:hypothetical protein
MPPVASQSRLWPNLFQFGLDMENALRKTGHGHLPLIGLRLFIS